MPGAPTKAMANVESPPQSVRSGKAVTVGAGFIVSTTGVRVELRQPVARSRASAKKVLVVVVPAGGAKRAVSRAKGVPPVAAAYQSMVWPAATCADKTGNGAPLQIAGLEGLAGAATIGQLQIGGVTLCTILQPALLMVTLKLVSMGILLKMKVAPFVVSVPALPLTDTPKPKVTFTV